MREKSFRENLNEPREIKKVEKKLLHYVNGNNSIEKCESHYFKWITTSLYMYNVSEK